MDQCGVPGCLSRLKDKGGYSFFPVPTDPILKNIWETRLKLSDLPQSSVICEKHFPSEEVIQDDMGGKTLKPNAAPSLQIKTEDEGSSVRRSNRKRVPKKSESSKGGENQTGKKKAARPLFKTATKSPEKMKRTRASKREEDNSNPKQDFTAEQTIKTIKRKKSKESCDAPSKKPVKVELVGDDERSHAIAEWYLLDVFEATRVITNVLHTGTLVTDCLVANMEETIIETISKLLQRLSSVLITSMEQEFGIKCNILQVLRNLHENIKEDVDQLATKEEEEFEPDEDAYEQALRCLDSKKPVNVIEEVISSPFDEDFMLTEHAYCRPSEQEVEKCKKTKKGEDGLSSMRQKLQCGFCSFKTYWKSKLRRHVKHHLHFKKRFECNVCEYTASTTEAYSKHVRTHTGEKPFSCGLCDFRTANRSNLNRHKIIHDSIKPFACPYCEHATRQKGSLMLHIENAHSNTVKPKVSRRKKSVYACGDCSFITISRPEFIVHNKTHTKFNCRLCDFIGNDSEELGTHLATHNGEDHVCRKCYRKFGSPSELILHLETHEEAGPLLSCDLCSYRTFRAAYLKRHVATHSRERPFQCSLCLNTFRLQSHLNMHIRRHEIGPYCKKSTL